MLNPVENQYTNWVYPLPVEDMRLAIAQDKYWEYGDPYFLWPRMWPMKRGVENLDILIAGCGSNQAAYYACRNPNWNVTGIDFSENSLTHQKKLKEKHALTNLDLRKLDLREVSSLGQKYDLIVSTGVLHHLPSPDAGLNALREVLKPTGVMSLMVYGKSLRLGVYVMQEVFKILGLGQSQKDVDIVKATIQTLPADHVVKRYSNEASDLHYDAAWVDTFLHPQDQAYYVKDIFDFTRRNGLEFISWVEPAEYSLECFVPHTHPVWEYLKKLNSEEAAHICDLLTQSRGTHRWIAGHPDYVSKLKTSHNQENFQDFTVMGHRELKLVKPADINTKAPAICERGTAKIELDFRLAAVFSKLKLDNSIRDVLNEFEIAEENRGELMQVLKDGFNYLHQQGHVHILLPIEKT